MEKKICIHGHFYQPPRENPWLETVERQDSAYPYHDWNDRITAECYLPNSASRILNDNQEIVSIVNNYEKISFNFGPTLISWMENHQKELVQAIIQADINSRHRYSGHGSAIAQVYNHMILPLANSRDKYTQIYWGIKHFEKFFQRKSEGMWLSETAVNKETLEIMAELGIKFTILCPHQAKRIRQLNASDWQELHNQSIDTCVPYLQKLSSGRSIAIFFYDDNISKAIAFNKLLTNGSEFASTLINHCKDEIDSPQLLNIATDGETYGHHHANGDMALAYALNLIESQRLAELTNYGEFLEKNPPKFEVDIVENSSWSCAHGVERWKSDCGCNSGLHPGWQQKWRAPLRAGLDWLRDALIGIYEEQATKYLRDIWQARNDYIYVNNDRSDSSVNDFFKQHAINPFNEEEMSLALTLLEMQRHAMLMYTSCGWFFDDISGIETVQILQYAARAMQLANTFSQNNLEEGFLERLNLAPSNIAELENGRNIYEKLVKPMMLELPAITAHLKIHLS